MSEKNFKSDRILSYFKKEWLVLLIVTVSGLIYNIGLLAGPLFEGKMTGCLIDILNGNKQFADMLTLVLLYILITAAVQSSRYIKRFYVRRFANNVNKRMKRYYMEALYIRADHSCMRRVQVRFSQKRFLMLMTVLRV
ncbi:MAG: hypothetical protein PUD13_08425 [Lachnospira sp.]|nr:hypothetical protein [Lachnospira sp.]